MSQPELMRRHHDNDNDDHHPSPHHNSNNHDDQRQQQQHQLYLSEQNLRALEEISSADDTDADQHLVNGNGALPQQRLPIHDFAAKHCPSPIAMFLRKNEAFLRLAFPASLVQFLRNAILSIGTVVAGRSMPSNELAGFVLGSSWTNMMGVAFVMGFTSSLDSFLPQLYGNGKNGPNPRLGVYLRTAFFFLVAASILYYFATELFSTVLLSKLNPTVMASAQEQLRPSVLTVFGTGMASACNKFFNAQKRPEIALYSYAGACLISIFLFVFVVNKSPAGISLAVGLGRCSAAGLMFFFGQRDEHIALSWQITPQQSSTSLAHSLRPEILKEFFILAIPSIVSSVADRWLFEAISILLALKYRGAVTDTGNVEVAAFGVLTNIWISCFPFGVACYVAGSSLVGNELGAGNGLRASRATTQTLRMTVLLCGGLAVLMFIFHIPIVALVVKDGHIRDKVRNNFLLFICFGFTSDAMQFVLQGVLRACNSSTLSTVNFVAYSAVLMQWGLGFSIVLMLSYFHDTGLIGIGVGMFIGNGGNAALQFYYLKTYIEASWDVLAHAISLKRHQDANDVSPTSPAALAPPSAGIVVPPLNLTGAAFAAAKAAEAAAHDEQDPALLDGLDDLEADRHSQENDDEQGGDGDERMRRRSGALSWEQQ